MIVIDDDDDDDDYNYDVNYVDDKKKYLIVDKKTSHMT